MKFCLLASGSRGNCLWLEESEMAVVVDCGLPAREFLRRAESVGLDPRRLAALLISHEHRDHLSGAGPLARRLKLPVLVNQATRDLAEAVTGPLNWKIFTTGDTLTFGLLKIRTLPISHDAADPVAFLAESPAGRLGLVTDLGAATELLRQKFQGLNALILEFNHDYRLLMDGPYPWPLKQRIRGRTGHLANEDAAALVSELNHAGLRHLVLAHLSETNNHPELALAAARKAVSEALEPVVAGQHEATRVFEV
jgi:phosphoribosyl 1,2-cyclic phosphodiesterase